MRELVFLAVLADVGHGRAPVSHRGAVDSFPLVLGSQYDVFAVRSPDCLRGTWNQKCSSISAPHP